MTDEVKVRRYVCVRCHAVITVGPCGLVRRHLYTVGAIALSLWLWSHKGQPPAEVRRRVSPWPAPGASNAGRWASLRRWAKRVRDGTLWPFKSAGVRDMSLRDAAARAVQGVLAHAEVGTIDEARLMAATAHFQ